MCRKGIQMAHWGACTNMTEKEQCANLQCPDTFENDVPVCGSDGNVYRYLSSSCILLKPQQFYVEDCSFVLIIYIIQKVLTFFEMYEGNLRF